MFLPFNSTPVRCINARLILSICLQKAFSFTKTFSRECEAGLNCKKKPNNPKNILPAEREKYLRGTSLLIHLPWIVHNFILLVREYNAVFSGAGGVVGQFLSTYSLTSLTPNPNYSQDVIV